MRLKLIARYNLPPQPIDLEMCDQCHGTLSDTIRGIAQIHAQRSGVSPRQAMHLFRHMSFQEAKEGFVLRGDIRAEGLSDVAKFMHQHWGPEEISMLPPDCPATRALVHMNRLWSRLDQHRLVLSAGPMELEFARPLRIGPAVRAMRSQGTYFADQLRFDEKKLCVDGRLWHRVHEDASDTYAYKPIGIVSFQFKSHARLRAVMAIRTRHAGEHLRISGVGSQRKTRFTFRTGSAWLRYAPMADDQQGRARPGEQQLLYLDPGY